MAPGRECHHPDVWDHEIGAVDSTPAFRRTLWKAGFEDKVTVVCAKAHLPSEIIIVPEFVFIDGSHDGDDPLWDYLHHTNPPPEFLAFHDTPIPAVAAACRRAEADGWVMVDAVGSLKVYGR